MKDQLSQQVVVGGHIAHAYLTPGKLARMRTGTVEHINEKAGQIKVVWDQGRHQLYGAPRPYARISGGFIVIAEGSNVIAEDFNITPEEQCHSTQQSA